MTNNIPKIRFNGFSDKWEEKLLGNIMKITSVKRIHQSDWCNEGVRFLRARDIVAIINNEKNEDLLFISKEKYDEYSAISGKVKIGDLLVTGVGTIGVPFLIKDLNPLYFKDGNIIWFQNNKVIDGTFFYFSFLGKTIQSFIKESAGIGTVGTYTIESGKKTPIYIPLQNSEQSKIGNFFNNIDKLITTNEQKLEKLKNIKTALLDKMFSQEGENTPKIRFKGFSDKWEKKSLYEIFDFMKGRGLSKEKLTEKGKYKCILYGELFTTYKESIDKIINNTNYFEGIISKQYDVLMPCSTTTTGSDLAIASSISFDNILLGGDIGILRPKIKHNTVFYAYQLRTMQKQIIPYTQGITIVHLLFSAIPKMKIAVPSHREQEKIATLFKKIDKLILLTEQKIKKLKNVKSGLLEKMFV